jgi:hypothetical protein
MIHGYARKTAPYNWLDGEYSLFPFASGFDRRRLRKHPAARRMLAREAFAG